MNVHAFYNDGQKILFDRFFVRTLVDEWDVVCHKLPSSNAIDYGTPEFAKLMLQKVSILVNHIIPSESKSEFFILSDIDIQFFGKCGEVVAAAIEGKDIVFQSEHGGNSLRVNTGFIAMKSNEKVLDFWKQVEQVLLKDVESNRLTEEQQVVNQLLLKTNCIQWGMFPSELWAWSNPDFSPPQPNFSGILLHHANYTAPQGSKSSLQLKIEQLGFVANAYQYWAGQERNVICPRPDLMSGIC
jgi:hypothetical protein